ncbi:menaquinone biosynthetic enzyme MqnA/MqnD family protein [Pedobacter sp. SAFR-022]|uniref:menaquinone biosynthetic enzyme MqnA/MqnD family protein n=1 Tax=Pedobacter sp. SAFR-022 TaxID=3436861 RepID=UPI003F80AF35
MNKVKISAVSYTNSKPFIYGIEHSDVINQIDLSLDIPSDCAARLIDGQVDVGLIPVAAIPHVPNANIIANYCIGSVGAVNSVFIFSNVPVEQIRTVKLDKHSRTSNNLAKVLLKFYWKQEVEFTTDLDAETDAMVLIGDRTFGKKNVFPFWYDMGEQWMNFTGLPFVYAAWVANKELPADFKQAFDKALELGLENRKAVIDALPAVAHFDLDDYLMNKLDFSLTAEKREALRRFLDYITKL